MTIPTWGPVDPMTDLYRRVRNLERLVQQHAAARTLENATIAQGGLTVTGGGAITVNPGGTSASLEPETNIGSGAVVAASLRFRSSDPSVTGSAQVTMIESGATSPLHIGDLSNTAYLELMPEQAEILVNGLIGGGATALFQVVNGAYAAGMGLPGGGIVGAAGTVEFSAKNNAYLSASADVYLQSGGGVYITQYRFSTAPDGLTANIDAGNVRWQAYGPSSPTGNEWRAQNTGGTYIPVRASSFPVSSSRTVKRDLADIPFDALAAIHAAPVQQWRYNLDHAAEEILHISPMAEDLPPELVAETDGVAGVDLLSLVGTLWAAVARLAERVEALEADAVPNG